MTSFPLVRLRGRLFGELAAVHGQARNNMPMRAKGLLTSVTTRGTTQVAKIPRAAIQVAPGTTKPETIVPRWG